MERLLNQIVCWLENVFNLGFGSPDVTLSKAGTFTITGTSTDWFPVCSAMKASLLTVRNTGLVELEYHYHDRDTVGQTLPSLEVFAYDKFKGTLYVRNAAGTGGTIRWLFGGRH